MTTPLAFRARSRPHLAWLAIVALALAGGCSTPGTLDVMRLDADTYAAAFDAAVDAARSAGLTPALRDRRGGVIETETRIAPSLLEPWTPGGSFAQRVEQTVALRRHRARFEFTPAAFAERERPGTPDVLGLDPALTDLTGYDGALELRVWVYVEQSHTPGVRRSTWSLRETTQTRIVSPADDRALPSRFWTPVIRDRTLERTLLDEVAEALSAG